MELAEKQTAKITPDMGAIRGAKARGERIAALTAYDYPHRAAAR
jgi:hypothetical protein